MKKPNIFLIHGIFMHGVVMSYLQLKLKNLGYNVHIFSYNSVKNSLSDNAANLVDFVQKHGQTEVASHFVGHSLGGLLIRLAYEKHPSLFTGRIVTLGTPHNGSLVATRVANDFHRGILGGAYENALDGELPDWPAKVELGSLAGTTCIGVGLGMSDLPKPNDGTVSVSETQLIGQSDHVALPLSHTALVYSGRVVKQIDHFLRTGRFVH